MKDVALAMLMKQAGERLKASLLEAIAGLDEHEEAGGQCRVHELSTTTLCNLKELFHNSRLHTHGFLLYLRRNPLSST